LSSKKTGESVGDDCQSSKKLIDANASKFEYFKIPVSIYADEEFEMAA